MKKLVLIAIVFTTFITACSKDDAPTKKCESCTLDGEKVEACDNGDGTWTITMDGSTTTLDEELFELLEVTPKEYIESICDGGPSI
nr:hypothetical protein [uncultured Allomuricauda sp.]